LRWRKPERYRQNCAQLRRDFLKGKKRPHGYEEVTCAKPLPAGNLVNFCLKTVPFGPTRPPEIDAHGDDGDDYCLKAVCRSGQFSLIDMLAAVARRHLTRSSPVVRSVLTAAVVQPLTGTPQGQRVSAAGCTGRRLVGRHRLRLE